MAVFSTNSEGWGLDFFLLRNSPVHLYWRRSVLDEEVNWLKEHRYVIHRWEAAWPSRTECLTQIKKELGLPEAISSNLDAFRDDLTNYLDIPDDGGIVFIFDHYDLFVSTDARAAHAVLDIIAESSRFFLLFGRRLLALVQTDDPHLRFDALGASPAMWSRKESLASLRESGARTADER